MKVNVAKQTKAITLIGNSSANIIQYHSSKQGHII